MIDSKRHFATRCHRATGSRVRDSAGGPRCWVPLAACPPVRLLWRRMGHTHWQASCQWHSPKVPRTGCRRRGVSLMELAALSASVVVLSALLLPALHEGRRQSKELRCLANLGRIAEASMVYASQDPSDFVIPQHERVGTDGVSLGEYEWGGKSGMGQPVAGTDLTSSVWGTAEGRGPATRPLNKIIYGDVFPDHRDDPGAIGANWLDDARLELDVFHCPADYGYTGHHYTAWRDSGLTSYDHYGNSYMSNAMWIGVPGADCRLESNGPFLRPLSRVPVPAMTLLYLENCGRFAWRANYGIDGCGSLSSTRGSDVETDVRGWHGQMWTFQAVFVDGHVGTIRMEGHTHPQPFLARYPNCRDELERCHEYWQCVIIRGPGWHLDTLPAPPIPTGLPCGIVGGVANTVR